jgi:FKBP-type peptidyl-prolyl cis-trans isomerase
MKKIFAFVVITLTVITIQAQTKNTSKTAKPAQKPASTGNSLKTFDDSVNYAIGMNIVGFYKQQGEVKINPAIITRAINDMQTGKKVLMTDADVNKCMGVLTEKYQQKMMLQQQGKAKPIIEEGEKFLAVNKTRQGVLSTPSGLQYEVLRAGNGPKPSANDTVTVNYKGNLINGTVFDDSYARGEAATFPLNRVIRGWTEGVQLMPVGSKYKFYIPYQLGYGLNGAGAEIPGGSVLIFEVELLNINGK